MNLLRLASICATLLGFADFATAQIVGGSIEPLHDWSGGSNGDRFGTSVASAGDVNADGVDDVIIGAPSADPGGLFSAGSAMVYSGADGSLLLQWDGNHRWINLGGSVCGAGDVNADGFDDLVVGVQNTSVNGLPYSGSVYVFSGVNGSIIHRWDGERKDDEFGQSVSGAGDVNADGFADIIIGTALADANDVQDSGSAYVYSGLDGSLLYQWDGEEVNDFFGSAVAAAGDVNGDGNADLIIGAIGIDPAGMESAGYAVVYSGADGSRLHQWAGLAASDHFGSSVSTAGDINADGFDDLIVGAPMTDSNQNPEAGSAYVFSGANGSLLTFWHGKYAGDQFGTSVAGGGDFNADGSDDLIIGAPFAKPYGDSWQPGSAYIFSGMDGTLLFKEDGQFLNGQLGMSVSFASDFDQNGLDDVILGAPMAASPQTGSARIIGLKPFLYASTSTLSASAGGTIQLDFDFPEDQGGRRYILLISASGTGPTTYGIDIPLTWDTLMMSTMMGVYPGVTDTDLKGKLDLNGEANGSLSLPPGASPGLIGQSFYLAAISYKANQLPAYSSVAVTITITP